jgi:biotin carboxyl carrier protein
MRARPWRPWIGGALLTVLTLAAVGVHAATAQPAAIPVRAAISGEVLPLQLAMVGQVVKQGDAVLFVRSTTVGAVPAARAPVDGQVIQVLVRPGDHVNIGDVVAAIQPR